MTLIWSNEDLTFMMMFRSIPKINNLGLFFPTCVGWVFDFADDCRFCLFEVIDRIIELLVPVFSTTVEGF